MSPDEPVAPVPHADRTAPFERPPHCRHRGAEVRPGWVVCSHPHVLAPEGADLETCRICFEAGVFFDEHPIADHRQVKRSANRALWSKPWNLVKSMRDFVADGCRTLSLEDYRARLMVCTYCPERDRNTCSICGCHLNLKARGRAFRCPRDRWPPPSDTG